MADRGKTRLKSPDDNLLESAPDDIPRTSTLTLILGSLTAFGPLSIDMYLPAFPQIAHDFAVPILAPLRGGYVTSLLGWRALFALLGTRCLGAVIFFLPERKSPSPEFALAHAARTYAGIAKGRRFLGFALAGGGAGRNVCLHHRLAVRLHPDLWRAGRALRMDLLAPTRSDSSPPHR